MSAWRRGFCARQHRFGRGDGIPAAGVAGCVRLREELLCCLAARPSAKVQELRIDRQSLAQPITSFERALFDLAQMRPWTLRIDEVRRQWRDPAPIVNTGGK